MCGSDAWMALAMPWSHRGRGHSVRVALVPAPHALAKLKGEHRVQRAGTKRAQGPALFRRYGRGLD